MIAPKIIYTNKNPKSVLEIEEEPFITNRILSMNPEMYEVCEKVNRYTFYVDKRILFGLMWGLTPKRPMDPFHKYIKKVEEEGSKWSFLTDKISKLYNWSEGDLKYNLPLLIKLFEDKTILRKLFRFFGIDKKYYKQFDIPFKIEKRWF